MNGNLVNAGDFDLPAPFNLPYAIAMGVVGKKVRLIQGLLCLHGFCTPVDGRFHFGTDRAVRLFQESKGLTVDGIIRRITYTELLQPLIRAVKPIQPNGRSMSEMVIAYAEQHLMEHPREVGGQNKGPWVILYMNGNEGAAWPWCAGFVSFILKQACRSLNRKLPVKPSFSCDLLAISAKEKGLFAGETEVRNGNREVNPGSFFLLRRTPTDWVHTGIVVDVQSNYFHTIEGNTNDEGSYEGYEVCRRSRGYKNKDFILI